MDWLIYTTASAAGGKPKEPTPMSRPGVGPVPGGNPQALARDLAYVEYLRTHQGAAPPPGWMPEEEGGGDG